MTTVIVAAPHEQLSVCEYSLCLCLRLLSHSDVLQQRSVSVHPASTVSVLFVSQATNVSVCQPAGSHDTDPLNLHGDSDLEEIEIKYNWTWCQSEGGEAVLSDSAGSGR